MSNGLQTILNHADVFENAVNHPHDPTGHVDDTDYQAGGQSDSANADQRLAPQPQRETAGADNQQAVHGGDRHVHAGHDAAGQLGFFGLLDDCFASVLLLEVSVGKQLEGGDVGVAIDDTAHQF